MSNMKSALCQKIHDKWMKRSIEYLADKGGELIREAYEDASTEYIDFTKEDSDKYGNVTYNLKDSYGSAVYSYGELIYSSFRFIGAKDATEQGNGVYGRDEVTDFLVAYKAKPSNPLELVCVAAIDYAADLEDGNTFSGKKFVVISNIADEMQSLAAKVKGVIRQIGDI